MKYQRPSEVDNYAEAFDLFFKGYTQGIGFTSLDEDGDILLQEGPGDFDITNPDSWDCWSPLLTEEERQEVLSDAVSFFLTAKDLIQGEEERAGTDFHFTRNHHGAGFWDGDWEEGEHLTDLCKPFSTLELCGSKAPDGSLSSVYLSH